MSSRRPALMRALARLPDYLGGHVARQRHRAGARACGQPAAGAHLRAAARCCAALLLGAGQRRADRSRAWRCWRCSIRCCSALAALTERCSAGLLGARLPAVGAGAGALLHAAGAAEHHHRTGRRRSRHQRGRARRRHDAAAIAVHGRAAAGAAGDHGRHPHRRGVGDRHRDAVDADRPDQPRQLHLHRAADPELGVRAVRLRRRGGAGAARSISCWR